jgi:uncharacterized membrane protein YhaH (DUF805 family)
MGNMSWMLFSFSGRINRQRWWLWLIALLVVEYIIIFIVSALLGVNSMAGINANDSAAMSGAVYKAMIPAIIIGLIFLYPTLAIYTKRWHDRGKSGWWTLIVLVPIIGGIWALIEQGFLRGTSGANQFGPDPLA